MTRTKPAEVSFYIDADLLGPARILAQLRTDVTYPGDPGGVVFKRERPACSIRSTATPDRVWIPVVTGANLLIITRDHRIQAHRAEIAAVVEHRARMVAVSSPDSLGTFGQLEVIFTQWRRIEDLTTAEGPFIYSATRASFKPVVLGTA